MPNMMKVDFEMDIFGTETKHVSVAFFSRDKPNDGYGKYDDQSANEVLKNSFPIHEMLPASELI
jgi:hypothetical protein